MYLYDDFYCRHSSRFESVYDLFIRIWNPFLRKRRKGIKIVENGGKMLGDYSRLSHYEGDKNHSFENEITVLRLSCYVEHQRHVRNTNIYSTGNCISCAVENNVFHPQQPLYKLVICGDMSFRFTEIQHQVLSLKMFATKHYEKLDEIES